MAHSGGYAAGDKAPRITRIDADNTDRVRSGDFEALLYPGLVPRSVTTRVRHGATHTAR